MRPVLLWPAILVFAACTPDPNGPGGGGGGGSLSTTPPGPRWSGVATAVAVGEYANCLLDGTGQPWCWGARRAGFEFLVPDGYPGEYQRDSVCAAHGADPAWSGWPCVPYHPVRVATKALASLRLSGSTSPLCGMDPSGGAFCWDVGALYAVTPDSSPNGLSYCGGTACYYFPQRVNVTEALRAFLTGQGGAACALTSAGVVSCAGSNQWGLLGTGLAIGSYSVTLRGVTSPVTFTALEVSYEGNWACGLTAAGKPYCWGYNLWGQLGRGSTDPYSATPASVSSTLTFQQIALSARTACALSSGKAYCWGFGHAGELGWNGLGESTVPVAVSGNHTFTSLIAGATHFCGLEGTTAWCWGYDYYGQLGADRSGTCPGGGVCSAVPIRVNGGLSFAKLAAGYGMSCGITTAQELYCWGQAAYGRLGYVPPATGLIGHPVKITP